MHHTLSIHHLSVDGHLPCLYFLAILCNALYEHLYASFYMDICFHFSCVCVCVCVCILGSYAKAVFNFLRNAQAVLHRSCTISHSHQQCDGSDLPASSPALVSANLFDCSPPAGCEVMLWFSLAFPWCVRCWAPFMCLLLLFCFGWSPDWILMVSTLTWDQSEPTMLLLRWFEGTKRVRDHVSLLSPCGRGLRVGCR